MPETLFSYENYTRIGMQIVIRRKCDQKFCLRELMYSADTKYWYWEYKQDFPKKLDANRFAYNNNLEFIDEHAESKL